MYEQLDPEETNRVRNGTNGDNNDNDVGDDNDDYYHHRRVIRSRGHHSCLPGWGPGSRPWSHIHSNYWRTSVNGEPFACS